MRRFPLSIVTQGCVPGFLALVIALLSPGLQPAVAASPDRPPLDAEAKHLVIDTVLRAFETHYLDPELAQRMSAHVRERVAAGTYSGIDELSELCHRLSDDLHGIVEDRHLWVGVLSPDDLSPAIGEEDPAELIERRARKNFGWRGVEWLPGNIGYVRIDRFDDAAYAGHTAVAALNFMAGCEAVIVDLRNNHGGKETMVRLVASHFFSEPRLLGSFYFTEADSLEQSWTQVHVPGRRLDHADLYILTSQQTASAAEAFSYALKHQERARVVGEKTRGAAHWAEDFDFPEIGVRVGIPIARPINPVTGTNWEGTGVIPDIAVPADDALRTAAREALKAIIARCSDEERRREMHWQEALLEARLNPITVSQAQMEEVCGQYDGGQYEFHVEGGKLVWTSGDGTAYGLVPMVPDTFGFDDGDENYRLQFLRDDGGGVSGFRLLTLRGDHPVHVRTGPLEDSGRH